jgi:type III pantothenate kinase
LHRKLIIDIGNTLQKLAVFEGKTMLFKETFDKLKPDSLTGFIAQHGPFDGIIQSSVIIHTRQLEEILAAAGRFILLTDQTPLPFRNLYRTPKTLGKDRIAAVAGARTLFPGRNCLVIDAGTCITYDLITAEGTYLGGGISPGIRMRFKALHTFTGKLPLIEQEEFDDLIGQTTQESILSGVYNGITGEITHLAGRYHEKFGDLAVVITGGDHHFLHNKLKISIFAAPDLVLLGLNEILDYNDHSIKG